MKNNIFTRILAIALVAMSIMAIALPALAEYSTMYVNCPAGETVRLRSGPGTSYTVLINIPYGTAVQAEYYNSTWHRVKYNGYTGYMMSSFLSSTNPADSGWINRYGAGVMNSANGTHTQVMHLQSDLTTLGYDVGSSGVDGYYGPDTTEAVKQFQRDYNLTVDGKAGPQTKAILYDLYLAFTN